MKNKLIWGLLGVFTIGVFAGTVSLRESSSRGALRSCVEQSVDILEVHYPLPFPVEIVIAELPDYVWGRADLRDGVFYLTVADHVEPGYLAEETAVHEWAHFLVWQGDIMGPPPPSWHHDEWGKAYATCYRLLFEEHN